MKIRTPLPNLRNRDAAPPLLPWHWLALVGLMFAGMMPAFATDTLRLPPLTTVPHSPRAPGKFVWADLVTDDVSAARTFYTRLFGWTFRQVGNYTIASNDERPVCGMFQRPRPADRPDAHARWFGYISVASVGKAQRAVRKAGGRVLAAPRKMPNRGEQAVFADAGGAVFGVVRSSSGDPPDFLPEPGDWIWCELLSRDAQKAAEFYRSVCGYQIVENKSDSRRSDYLLVSNGYARASVRTLPKDQEEARPTWLLFVRVKNVRESVALARQLGGQILIEPNPEVFDSKVAVIADSTGAAIGLLEWSDEIAK